MPDVRTNNIPSFDFEDEASLCIKDQVQAGAWSGDFAIVFSPECNEDASFKTVQCQTSTGYCWCVDNRGNEIWGTKIRGKPNCTDIGMLPSHCLNFTFCSHL